MKHSLPTSESSTSTAGVNVTRRKRLVTSRSAFASFPQPRRGLPYDLKLRHQVISAIKAGASCNEVAAQYGISKSVVGKWVRRFRRTGSFAAKPMGGDRFSALQGERDWILMKVSKDPHLTIADLHRELAARGIRVGYGLIRRFLIRAKVTLS